MAKLFTLFSLSVIVTLVVVANSYRSTDDLVVVPQERPVAVAGELASYRFMLRNDSRMPIAITDIQRSCGCQIAELDQEQIDVGGTAILTVSARLKSSDAYSTMWVAVRYKGNGPREIRIPIEIDEVHAPIISRSSIDFGETNALSTETLTIRPDALHGSCGIEVLERNSKGSNIVDASIKTVSADQTVIVLTINEDPPQGFFVEEVVLMLRCGDKEFVQCVACRGLITPTVRVSPEIVTLKWPTDGTSQTASTEIALDRSTGNTTEVLDAQMVGENAHLFDIEYNRVRILIQPNDEIRFSLGGTVVKNLAVRCTIKDNEGRNQHINIPVVVHH